MKNWNFQNTWIDFGPQIRTIKDIKVGCQATIIPDGGVPDGDYTMPSGAIWSFINGELVSMGDPVKKGIIQFHSCKRALGV
jgi:hypothetical protein